MGVEVCEPKEGLNILYLARDRPIEYCFDFGVGHGETVDDTKTTIAT